MTCAVIVAVSSLLIAVMWWRDARCAASWEENPPKNLPRYPVYMITRDGAVSEVTHSFHVARCRAIEMQCKYGGVVRMIEMKASKAVDFMPEDRK